MLVDKLRPSLQTPPVRSEEIQSALLQRLFEHSRNHPNSWCSFRELQESLPVAEVAIHDALFRLETSGVIIRSNFGHGWRLKD